MNKFLSNIVKLLTLIIRMGRYNLKIIFAGKFVWFILSALVFYILLAINLVYDETGFDSSSVYSILVFPGILLVFYPTVFGVQNDADARILEILFGIPDYRYKIWLARIAMIFLLTWVLILLFCVLGYYGLITFSVFGMSGQLMFPILFLGCMSFMVSTMVKNGNGTAVIMVIIGVALLIFSEALQRTYWNVFLNPYSIPKQMNEMVWEQITNKNRIFLIIGSITFLLVGLTNLQKREKFLK